MWGGPGGDEYAKLTMTSEKQGPPGGASKKDQRQSSLHDGYGLTEISKKIVSATIHILFLTIFRYNLYFFTKFF